MPVVPFPQREDQARAPQVNPIFLAAAMADLHQAGMLVEPEQTQTMIGYQAPDKDPA